MAPYEKVDAGRDHNLPAKVAGQHRWIMVASHSVSPGQASAAKGGAVVTLDNKNRVGLDGPGCYDCEQTYEEAKGKPCPGDPSEWEPIDLGNPDDPRETSTPGTQLEDPFAGPDKTNIDTRRAIHPTYVEGTATMAMRRGQPGEPLIALTIRDVINKSGGQEVEHLYALNDDAAGVWAGEILGLAHHIGSDFAQAVLRRFEEQLEERKKLYGST